MQNITVGELRVSQNRPKLASEIDHLGAGFLNHKFLNQNTVRAITRLAVELQSSRSVQSDQRDETNLIFLARAPSAENPGCGVDARPLKL